MKKFARETLTVMVVAGFFSGIVQAEPTAISDAEIKDLLNRHVLHLTHPNGYAESITTLYFKPDNTISVLYPEDRKEGSWHIDNGKLCRKFGEKKERCGRILKDGDRYSYENNNLPLNIELRPLTLAK